MDTKQNKLQQKSENTQHGRNQEQPTATGNKKLTKRITENGFDIRVQ